MKKTLKIVYFSIGALAFLATIAICFAIWFAFTPGKLTPFIRKQVAKTVSCQSEIGEVELTFFSTFPSFGLKITNFALYHAETTDTIVKAEEMVGILNTTALWARNELVLNEIIFSNGTIHLFTDSLGQVNYDVLIEEKESPQTEEPSFDFNVIEIEGIKFNNINLSYIDEVLKVNTYIEALSAKLSGSLAQNQFKSSLLVNQSTVTLKYDTIQYLNRADAKLHLNSEYDLAQQHLSINNGSVEVNELNVDFNGDITNDTLSQSILTDIQYNFKSWPVGSILSLVPEAYQQYLQGIKAEGMLSSSGKVKGAYSDNSWPIFDINLLLEDGTLSHPLLQLPLDNLSANLSVYADWQKPDESKVTINHFAARSPKSEISTKGAISQLFADIHCNLETKGNLSLDEVNIFIPKELKTTTRGYMDGTITTDFSLSQLTNLELEKMKLAGSFALKNINIKYDTLTVTTNQSDIEFALPNPNPSRNSRPFVYVKLNSKQFHLGSPKTLKLDMEDASLVLEAADLRDTTKIAAVYCAFDIQSLNAQMDTSSLSIVNPHGKLTLLASRKLPNMPEIQLAYRSEALSATSGKNKASFNNLDLNTTVINNKKEKEILKQWIASGMINLDKANIQVSALNHPIEIPALEMDFTPEEVNIHKSEVKISQSDFQLSGILKNLMPYVKGDSLLRGDFNFSSTNTDVTELMMLTNGIGNSEEESLNSSSPYMVPKGIDIALKTKIDKASFGTDTATNINGALRVSDGLLVLDAVKFTTPAAKMQLTAMYRTPRKNHLFVGLDYHMLDVEISELLKMIPDIDSMMPMLRSFGGRGEFHIAAETYLDSMYNIKKSTLRGASSIKGQNLVLMDGETFSEIAKTLKFNKKTENRVDSLSAEFTIFKQEIDIYPFLMVMDKYKAVVAGQHNLDLSFNYHISVVDCPLPIKLGIDVKGTMDDLKYSLEPCKYKEFYRPSSRRVVENKQLEIRKMIREALLQKLQTNKAE
ncbi:MAG: hypothetical protein KBH01_06140 [Breznakibacter sp.]|nr:hypothetical protein [Breznakibacter sp.]